MGLDQYAFAVYPNPNNTPLSYVDERPNGEPAFVEIAYWRKHPNLHGWMEVLWSKKAEEIGTDISGVSFNCTPVELRPEDIDALEKAVSEDVLPHTEGFFFGQSHPEHVQQTFEFIEEARAAFARDMQVYYDSWW